MTASGAASKIDTHKYVLGASQRCGRDCYKPAAMPRRTTYEGRMRDLELGLWAAVGAGVIYYSELEDLAAVLASSYSYCGT